MDFPALSWLYPEKARDTAIKTLEQAATRAATTRKPQR
jgi:hypothetical protein